MTYHERMQEKYGSEIEEFSVSENTYIKNGVIRKRTYSDYRAQIIFFVVFLWVLISSGIFVSSYQDVDQWMAPIDANGRTCGYDEGVQNYTYLYYLQISGVPDLIGNSTVCVESCPKPGSHFINCTEDMMGNCTRASGDIYKNSHGVLFGKVCWPEWDGISKDYDEEIDFQLAHKQWAVA